MKPELSVLREVAQAGNSVCKTHQGSFSKGSES